MHEDWWVRRHAIEATWRFFARTYAPYGEDIGPTWLAMREEILQKQDEVVRRLRERLQDPDLDVRASAEFALKIIESYS